MYHDALKLNLQFAAEVARIEQLFVDAPSVQAASWQSVRAPQPMPEIFNYSFTLDLLGVEDLTDLAKVIRPNLPWADNHFREDRVSGHPVNPGNTWRQWPFALSANRHRRKGEEDPQFDHSYAERYWPKFAGTTPGGVLNREHPSTPHMGIRDPYGDLRDLIELLIRDPLTRQGFLPVWFPEDLHGALSSKRVPCTLGYHFIRRGDVFHCVYFIRSCDYIRHFRDDVYLTIRLQLWILQMLRFNSPEKWAGVKMGTFTMHITSLHMFEHDRDQLVRGLEEKSQ